MSWYAIGVGEGEGPVAAAALAERLVGILDVADGRHGVREALEALDEQRLDDAELRLEVVVDAHGRDAGGGGDPADREAVGALGLEDVGGRGEEGRLHPGARDVLVRRISVIVSSLLKNIVL